MSMLGKYLLGTTLVGGVLGGIHGVISLPPVTEMPDPMQRRIHVAMQAQLGSIAVVWAPVLGSLMLQGSLSQEQIMHLSERAKLCPFVHPPPAPPGAVPLIPDLPTVAEIR